MKRLLNSTLIALLLLLNAVCYGIDKSDFRIVGYFASWNNVQQMAKSFDYSKVTHLNYCFTNVSDTLGSLDEMGADLDTLVRYAHANNVKVLISLGGGAMSAKQISDYKYQIKNEANRARFISSINDYLVRYKLDGFDVDIEGDRITSNYGAFIKQLTDSLQPKGFLVTAALGDWGGNNVPDEVVPLFDFINIMSYDATGNWNMNNVGQHSSFELALHGLEMWEGKGASRDKLVIGLPFYGYAFNDLSSMGFAYYKDILDTYPDAYDQDTVGAIIFYNGISTIKRKTNLALDSAGGVMIWELAYDTHDEYSLLKAINDAVSDYNADDLPPTVNIEIPTQDTAIQSNEIKLKISATDLDGTFYKTKIYIDGIYAGESKDSIASFTLRNIEDGTYNIIAEAIDHQFRTNYDTLLLSVNNIAETYTFNNEIITIPGKIEAENFDVGGSNESYVDGTPENQGQSYRVTQVDIEPCFDRGGGYDIGWTASGEWLVYTVNVSEDGYYAVDFRTATTNTNKTISLLVDDEPVISNFKLTQSGGWQVWNSSTYNGIQLSEGTHTFKIDMNSGGFNLNYLLIYPSTPNSKIDQEESNLKLFPNPAKEVLFIKDKLLTDGIIIVRNINGQIVLKDNYLSVNESFHELDISILESGLYVLEISNAKTRIQQKFIKK